MVSKKADFILDKNNYLMLYLGAIKAGSEKANPE